MKTYSTIAEIKQANADVGGHFFDTDTLRFFGSRILATVYGGFVFVTSEKDSYGAWDGQRRYTVRFCFDGTIEGLDFGQFANLAQAKEEAENWSDKGLEAVHTALFPHLLSEVSA
jgi:hypothetical protein